MKKRIIPILLLVVIAAAGYWAYTTYGQTSAIPAGALGGSGTIETDQIAVTPQASGRIISSPAEEGVAVKKGDVLYRLDPAILTFQMQQAAAGVNAATANYSHVKADSGSSSADVVAAKTQLDQAKIALSIAKVQVGYATIASPMDGVIASIAARTGENAVPGSTLAMISNPASLTVTIYVAESDIGKVKVGQTGVITTDSTTKSYHGDVVFIGTQAEFTPASIETKDQRVKLVYQVKVRVTDVDTSLKPGMPADVVLK